MPSQSAPVQAGKRSPLTWPQTSPILIALSGEERALFFPNDYARQLPNVAWVDVHGMGRDSWSRLITTSQPRVIITGWSTPTLNIKQTTAGGGPVDYVCHVAGSVRHIISREMVELGLKVTNWNGLVAPLVAEHALLLILAALRNLGSWRSFMMQPPDQQRKELLGTRTLYKKRVSIHGFGAIARELIRLLKPFDVDISVFSMGVPASLISEHGASAASSLTELCKKSDVFITCEALTTATHKCINAQALYNLPEGSVFVNVGRGAIVDEHALIEIGQKRRLRIASDVFIHEPLASDSPLLDMQEAVLSPHIAGPTIDYYAACGEYALSNVTRYLGGNSPVGLITTPIFDRST